MSEAESGAEPAGMEGLAGGEDEGDDRWLYGDAPPPEPEAPEPAPEPPQQSESFNEPVNDLNDVSDVNDDNDATNDDAHFKDELFEDGPPNDDNGLSNNQENGDSDSDSEDDVKVILGDIKTLPPSYPSLNIKRGGLLVQGGIEKQKHTGKFNVEEFEAVGTINGVPAQEYNIDVLEDKPWRKPGADITDYFNYGFNEDTWRAYCERQKRMRIHESGTGLIPLGGTSISGIQQPRHPTPILNDNSKYAIGFAGMRKAGPPPVGISHQSSTTWQPSISFGRKLTGPIDVIGGRRDGSGGHEDNPESPNKQNMQIPVRESTIQVMTADRREYSRNKQFPDMSLPPPGAMPPSADFFLNPTEQPFYPPPYQEDSWGNKSGWTPSDIKELTPGPISGMGPPPPIGMPPGMPGMGPPPHMVPHPSVMGGPMGGPPTGILPPYGPPHLHMHHREMDIRDRERDKNGEDMRDKDDHDSLESRDRIRERDRDRDRSRSIKPDRQREKSHRRERSRSRSRRHKSRSRSPSSRHRSKKKSSHRKDKDDSD